MARRVRTSFLVLILVALPALVFAIQTMKYAPFMAEMQDHGYNDGDLFANEAYPYQGELW